MSAPRACLTLKRGATFALAGQLLAAGHPVDISGWGVQCQLRAGARLVHAFAVAVTDGPEGRWAATPAAPGETAAWPAAAIAGDIRYADTSGRVLYTETFAVLVEDAITRAAP